MSYKSIKRLCRDAIKADFETTFATELSGVQVVSTFSGDPLKARHIRITTANATPLRVGERNMGRWDVECNIAAVTQIDDYDESAHDNLSGIVEAYVLQASKTLSAALSSAELTVDNLTVTDASEVQNEGMRYSSQQITLECFIPAA